MLEVSSISQILSSVTRVANINHGYTVTTVTHEDHNGKITSHASAYTVYDKSVNIQEDSTPRYGVNIDTRV